MQTKTINILLGPKGSGKTFIGQLLQERLGIHFLRVENIFIRIKQDRDYLNSTYFKEGFNAVEIEITHILETEDEITIESTGAAPQFDEMVEILRRRFCVRLIKVVADLDRCLERVKTRDKAAHIDVSDEHVMAINTLSVAKRFIVDFEIENNASTEEQIVQCFLSHQTLD
jgi:shikimate kinase